MGILLEQRQVPELMDAADLDAAAHDAALAGLRRLNEAAGAARSMGRAVAAFVAKAGLRRVTLLDVACGGGDVPVQVGRMLQAAGVTAELTLMDRSGTALEIAGKAAARAGLAARTVPGAAPLGLPEGTWDLVTNSLFLHHLPRGEVVATLREMGRRVRPGGCLVVSDLRRGRVAWGVTWVMCRLLTRSRIVHYDGPVSVRAAWTVGEMRAMAAEAGLAGGAVVRPSWPWRMVLVWENGGVKDESQKTKDESKTGTANISSFVFRLLSLVTARRRGRAHAG